MEEIPPCSCCAVACTLEVSGIDLDNIGGKAPGGKVMWSSSCMNSGP